MRIFVGMISWRESRHVAGDKCGGERDPNRGDSG